MKVQNKELFIFDQLYVWIRRYNSQYIKLFNAKNSLHFITVTEIKINKAQIKK